MPLLELPDNGVTVRMFRQGHGDCFLIAMPREGGGAPYYVLIDCGMKPGSQAFLDHKKPLREMVREVHAACGGTIDLAILTHEHQDHLNGIWSAANAPFADFDIKEAWVAWTEDPDNDLANEMRENHRDTLLGVIAARRQLAAVAGVDDRSVNRIDQLLGLELGGDAESNSLDELLAAAEDPEKSVNKQGLKLVKDKASANRGCFYLTPGGEPLALEGSAGVRAFILGPPENADLIADEDPKGDEAFPRDHSFSFGEAVRQANGQPVSPFRRQYGVPMKEVLADGSPFFSARYGKDDEGKDDSDGVKVAANAPWRRIDGDWLYSAETLALKLNTGINNTSLVVAFELPVSKKVLFFAADAQRGNWVSWKDVTFQDGAETVTARELMARTVLYKVGHHGSHNATLAGKLTDPHPNLSWMGQGAHAGEFTALITAVNKWAMEKNSPPWVHPLPSIKTALRRKAQGRVLQIDENKPTKPSSVSAGEWKRFTNRLVLDKLYFDLTIEDA
jgi:hypothetical protein